MAQFLLSVGGDHLRAQLAASSKLHDRRGFHADGFGTFHAQVTLTDNSGGVANATQMIALGGTGTVPAPVAECLAATLAFGGIQTGTASGTQQVTITNQGSAALNIYEHRDSGAQCRGFRYRWLGAPACARREAAVVAGGQVARWRAICAAASDLGVKSATSWFDDNAAGSPQTVALSGTATGAASDSDFAGEFVFRGAELGIASAPQTITVSNAGSSSLAINGFGMTGANSPRLHADEQLPAELARRRNVHGECCVRAHAFIGAPRSAILTIADNAAGSPQSVAAFGHRQRKPAIEIVPTSINFGASKRQPRVRRKRLR